MKSAVCQLITVLLLLAGCGVLNHPYRKNEHGQNYLYDTFREPPKHLDPAVSYSSGEYTYLQQIYEPPLQYHYLKRPYELIPLTVREVPEPVYYNAEGNRLTEGAPSEQVARAVYTLRIVPGIRYQDHPAFARDASGRLVYQDLAENDLSGIDDVFDFPDTGSKELTAADYVYQIKRMAHPTVDCPIGSYMANYILGLKELSQDLGNELARIRAERKDRSGAAYSQDEDEKRNPIWIDLDRFGLDGARVIDEHTYQITIGQKYPQFVYWLAMPFFAPMPRDVDRFYHRAPLRSRNLTIDNRPVGTGPYRLAEFSPNKQIVLVRNENFRGEPYPSTGEETDRAKGFLDDAGKTMPFIDKAIYKLEKESIPNWNKFLQGYYDLSSIGSEVFDQAVQMNETGLSLSDALQEKGIRLETSVMTSSYYCAFNMLDDVVGGYTEDKRKLRQAISIAIDFEEWIQIFQNGRGVVAQGMLPPGIFGHRDGPESVNPVTHTWDLESGKPVRRSIEDARRLLAEAGYPNGVGLDGKPLVIGFDTYWTGSIAKARFDWLRKQLAKLNIDLQIRQTDYNRFRDKTRRGNLQLFFWGWNADYPDPENFLFLLAGQNGEVKYGGSNTANYDNPEFNRLFKRVESMPSGPDRLRLLDRMIEVARQDAPWIWGYHPVAYGIYHSWYKNTKPMTISKNRMKYKRIEPMSREEMRVAWNSPVWWPVFAGIGVLVLGSIPAVTTVRRREREVELE